MRRFLGSREAINGLERYCIWVRDSERADAEAIPELSERFRRVAEFRANSIAPQTRPAAAFPHRFRQIQAVAELSSIVIPKVSSERRPYLPVAYLRDGEIVSDLAFALYDAPIWTFALLVSRLHLIWIEAVCGKLETRYRYSNSMGWHTFPVPALTQPAKTALTRCAEDILVTRARLGGTLAELYDPEKMPDELRETHRVNDETLEALYTRAPFRSDAERLNHLFRRYVRMIAREKGEPVDDEPELDFAEPAE